MNTGSSIKRTTQDSEQQICCSVISWKEIKKERLAIIYLIIRYGSLSQEKKKVYISFYSPFERKNCRRGDSRQHLFRLFE